MYHISSYIVFCNTHHQHQYPLSNLPNQSSPLSVFLLIFSIPESAMEWAGFGGGDVKSSQAWQFRDQEDLVINDQYDNIKDVCCDVSYHH